MSLLAATQGGTSGQDLVATRSGCGRGFCFGPTSRPFAAGGHETPVPWTAVRSRLH